MEHQDLLDKTFKAFHGYAAAAMLTEHNLFGLQLARLQLLEAVRTVDAALAEIERAAQDEALTPLFQEPELHPIFADITAGMRSSA